MSYLVAGVGSIQLFDPSSNALILTSKTLTDEGINFGSTAEEARGGMGNALLGKYYHDTSFGLTLTDQLFDLQYLALNCGGAIQATSDVLTNEQVTVTVANTLTVSKTPSQFNGAYVGWAKKPSESDSAYKLVTFNGVDGTLNGAEVGDVYCVKYFYGDSSARKFIVNTAYVPATVYAVATFPLFKAGTSTENFTSSSQVGEIQCVIPNFQLEGAQELALTSGGIANASLSGSALATFSGSGGCSDNGYYAIITEVIYGKGTWDNVVALAVADGDIDLEVDGTEKIKVYAIYSDGTTPTVIDNSLLKFTSESSSIATVGEHTGIVTGVAQGSTNILVAGDINASNVARLTTYAVATVTSA